MEITNTTTNETFTVQSLKLWCEENNLSYMMMRNCMINPPKTGVYSKFIVRKTEDIVDK